MSVLWIPAVAIAGGMLLAGLIVRALEARRGRHGAKAVELAREYHLTTR